MPERLFFCVDTKEAEEWVGTAALFPSIDVRRGDEV
jgi:hypothetical protein